MACSGGASDVGTGSTPAVLPSMQPVGAGPYSLSELTDLGQQFQDFADAINSAQYSAGIPSKPMATFDGFINVIETGSVSDRKYIGRITLDADFANRSVTGSTADYSEFIGTAADPIIVRNLTGTLPITNGVITDENFTAKMNRTLIRSRVAITVKSSIYGAFGAVNDQNIVGGNATGTAASSVGLGLFRADFLAAER